MTQPKILIVEDDEQFQKIAADTVGSLGYQWDVANDTSEALRRINESEYHGVLLDLCAPVTFGNPSNIEHGVNCLVAIRKIKTSHELPVLVMTNHTDKALHRSTKLREMGAQDTIAKSAFEDSDVSPSDIIRKMIESLPAFSKGERPPQKFMGGTMKIYEDRVELNDVVIISDKNARWSIPMLKYLAGQKNSSGGYAYRSGNTIQKDIDAESIGQITGAASTIRRNVIKRMLKENWECGEHDLLDHDKVRGYRINPLIISEICC